MAFKKAEPPIDVPDTPDGLFLDLPRRRIPDVLPHQRETMRSYVSTALGAEHVALQLPTGSGKTLVALLIGEWRRRKNRERIVYLCPTRQLVNQVVEQAEDKYGLSALAFTGSARDYDPGSIADYRSADKIAVTTYSSVFNTNPFFGDSDVLILDDVHAAESYIASLWSVSIERDDPSHSVIHTALCAILSRLLDPLDYRRLTGNDDAPADRAWVEKLSTPDFGLVRDEIADVLETHTRDLRLAYPWSMLRENLDACHLYFSARQFLIRPLVPPTWTHEAFTRPAQRIFMSATLGKGGDLERLTGTRSIARLPVPEGWDRVGVGRRFFIFPDMTLSEEEFAPLRLELMKRAGRSLVLVPSDAAQRQIVESVRSGLGYQVFSADDIEQSKRPFIAAPEAVAAVANRYDGIDFPGEECRLLFIDALPRATNLQERFLMSRMGAQVLFNERVQTRVLQAIGRCTRSLEDYSAVVVSGVGLSDYIADIRRRKFLHPELQAEIEFGVRQSRRVSSEDILENFETFLENGEDWEAVNQQIVSGRSSAKQVSFPSLDELNTIVVHEIDFQAALWQGDYETALSRAESVLGGLHSQELRGYRALWHYLAGSAAWLGGRAGAPSLSAKAQEQFRSAKGAAAGIRWLARLARYDTHVGEAVTGKPSLMRQIERIEATLEGLGVIHDGRFSSREGAILDGLEATEKGPFEEAHRLLGETLGFEAGNTEEEGSPDPWWITEGFCLVFEDHAGANPGSALDVKKARQAATHPNWIRENLDLDDSVEILSVLVTAVGTARKAAIPHLREVKLWPLAESKDWARRALGVLRDLRSTFVEPGDLEWRSRASDALETAGVSAEGLVAALRAQPADGLTPQ